MNTRYMSWTTVTPLSKLLALICFILFPFIAFYLGVQYQRILMRAAIPVQKNTPPTSQTAANSEQITCDDEAKKCGDGTFVFRQAPDCNFAACPNETPKTPPLTKDEIRQAGSKDNQILAQVSQKSGIAGQHLTITTKTTANSDAFTGGSYSGDGQKGWWIAAKQNDIWLVTSIGSTTPLCDQVNPYQYPKTLIPACKNAQGDIVSR